MEVEPIIRSALDGNNEGTNKQPGIVPQALEKLLSLAACDNSILYSFLMSMLEVYMGSLRGLICRAPKLPQKNTRPPLN
ncbi:hypothetical protein IFM89_018959, partial [Coptis chinensis]